jgi:hypothetical protein
MSEHDELAARVAKLEAELAEAKKALEAVKPKEPFRPRMNMQPIDWTEGMRMPPDAAQKMAAVVPDVKGKMTAEEVQSAWARSRISGPVGFGPAKWEEQKKPKVETAKVEKVEDHRSPQTRIFDAMVDAMVGGPNDTSKLR